MRHRPAVDDVQSVRRGRVKAALDAPEIHRGLDDVYVKETSICFIDGERGRLLYRGYDIRDLARHSSFEEVVFLLLQGRLPNRAELESARAELAAARPLAPSVLKLLRSMPEHAPPMDVLRTAVSYMSGFDPERDDSTQAANMRKALRITAQLATIVATYERIRKGQRVLRPDPTLGHAEDFVRMVTGKRPDPTWARMMDVAMVLYADHGMNASTFEETVAGELASKRIFPNVDFYSGLVFHRLGISTDLFTPVFALSRAPGWTAHVLEYWEDNRLLRPLDWYVGPKDLAYVPLDERA